MAELTSAEGVRQQALEESGRRCCMCVAHIDFRVEVVPIVPLSEGGPYTLTNLAVLCPFCRWLLARQKVSPTAVKSFKKQWQGELRRSPRIYHEHGLTIQGQPLRLEAEHKGIHTILEGSELGALLVNFFNCLDTFLIHEDQHLENAASLALIRAFRDMYNYVPPEKDIKEQATADSRKLDLLYRAIRALFAVGLVKPKPAAKESPKAPKAARPAKPAKSAKPAKPAKAAKPVKAAGKKAPAARGKSRPAKPAARAHKAPARKAAAARKPVRRKR